MPENPYKTPTHRRPYSVAEVAAWAQDFREFSYNLTDWLHEFRRFHSRPELAARVAEKPSPLAGKFPEGAVADAFLAAYVLHLCGEAGVGVPDWANAALPLDKPWFDTDAFAKTEALVFAPSPFRALNVFYVPPPVLTLAKGRPRVSAEQKRAKSAERQRRYRQKLLKAAGRKR